MDPWVGLLVDWLVDTTGISSVGPGDEATDQTSLVSSDSTSV